MSIVICIEIVSVWFWSDGVLISRTFGNFLLVVGGIWSPGFRWWRLKGLKSGDLQWAIEGLQSDGTYNNQSNCLERFLSLKKQQVPLGVAPPKTKMLLRSWLDFTLDCRYLVAHQQVAQSFKYLIVAVLSQKKQRVPLEVAPHKTQILLRSWLDFTALHMISNILLCNIRLH